MNGIPLINTIVTKIIFTGRFSLRNKVALSSALSRSWIEAKVNVGGD